MATLPYSYSFTGANGASLSSDWTVQTSNGTVTIQNNQGQLAVGTGTTAFTRIDLLGVTMATSDFDLSFDFRTTQPSTTATYSNMGIMGNSDNSAPGTNAGAGYYLTFIPSPRGDASGSTLQLGLATSTSGTIVQTTVIPNYYSPNAMYTVRLRCLSNVLYYKIWYTNTTEPLAWANTYTPGGSVPAGYVEIFADGLAASTVTFFLDNLYLYNPSTQTGLPGLVTELSVSAGDSSALVSFTPPPWTGGSAITSYVATINPGAIIVSSSSIPIFATGLTNGTSYTVSVHAVNANGNGPESNVLKFTPAVLNAVGFPWTVT